MWKPVDWFQERCSHCSQISEITKRENELKAMQAGEEAETISEAETANVGKKVLVTGSMRKMLCFILQIIYETCYRETK